MKRYVFVGTGQRGTMAYLKPLTEKMQDCVKVCGVYDINVKRAKVAAMMAAYHINVYDNFDRMLEEEKPDSVIVATKDAAHSQYIIKALDAGCDVVSEKPITTDEIKMREIYEAEQRSGKRVQVTFNCRFMPHFMRAKELLKQGVIGTPFSAHFEWLLDTRHGADYFRRWHAERKNSGSLLIHKSTHHFDLLNWFLDDEPEKVNAFGTRRFYGNTRKNHGERCLTCQYKNQCEFYCDDINTNELYRKLYLECEDEDGYFRDQCVFGERIDIEDTVSLNIKYKGGVVASYSLTAHSPYEGMRLCINGSAGRMEISTLAGSGAYAGSKSARIVVYNRLDERVEIIPSKPEIFVKFPELERAAGGGHGGSDMLLCDAIFRGRDVDPLSSLADSRAGAMSIGIGIAANKSMAENRAVSLNEFYDFY
jgi:predicted dehydrogenase